MTGYQRHSRHLCYAALLFAALTACTQQFAIRKDSYFRADEGAPKKSIPFRVTMGYGKTIHMLPYTHAASGFQKSLPGMGNSYWFGFAQVPPPGRGGFSFRFHISTGDSLTQIPSSVLFDEQRVAIAYAPDPILQLLSWKLLYNVNLGYIGRDERGPVMTHLGLAIMPVGIDAEIVTNTTTLFQTNGYSAVIGGLVFGAEYFISYPQIATYFEATLGYAYMLGGKPGYHVGNAVPALANIPLIGAAFNTANYPTPPDTQQGIWFAIEAGVAIYVW